MKADYVATWLESPNPAFGGLKPLEVVERGEIDRICGWFSSCSPACRVE